MCPAALQPEVLHLNLHQAQSLHQLLPVQTVSPRSLVSAPVTWCYSGRPATSVAADQRSSRGENQIIDPKPHTCCSRGCRLLRCVCAGGLCISRLACKLRHSCFLLVVQAQVAVQSALLLMFLALIGGDLRGLHV